jgi:hypothetical protein
MTHNVSTADSMSDDKKKATKTEKKAVSNIIFFYSLVKLTDHRI